MAVDSTTFGWPEARAAAADSSLAAMLESRSVDRLDDAELVDALAAGQRLANALEGRVLALMGELDTRRAAGPTRDCRAGRDITSRAQVVTEVAAATRQPKGRVEDLLCAVHVLRTHLPRTWGMLQTGRISGYQARIIADQCAKLTDKGLCANVEARILAEAEPDQHQARHKRAYADRRVSRRRDAEGDGMGTLSLHHDSVTSSPARWSRSPPRPASWRMAARCGCAPPATASSPRSTSP